MRQAEVIAFPRPASPQRLTWNGLLAMTHELLAQARAGDWSAALTLQQQRRPLLESYFQSHPEPMDRHTLADGIRVMLALDAEVARLASEHRDDLGRESRANHLATAAANVYLRHQGL